MSEHNIDHSRKTALLKMAKAWAALAVEIERSEVRATRIAFGDVSFTPSRIEPPQIAQRLVALFVTAKHKNALLGDLDEKFRSAIDEGCTIYRARRMYWSEALRTIGPMAWEKLKCLAAAQGSAENRRRHQDGG
jgi:hypothetical protein